MTSLPDIQYQVLAALARAEAPVEHGALAASMGMDQAKVSAACHALSEQGLLSVDSQTYREFRAGPVAMELPGARLPERAIIEGLAEVGGEADIPGTARAAGLAPRVVGQSLRHLKQKGWVAQKGKTLTLLDAGRAAPVGPDETLLSHLVGLDHPVTEAELEGVEGLDLKAALKLLFGRKGVLDIRERTRRTLALTRAGRALWAEGVKALREVNQLTSELLLSGEWREVSLRPYDVSLPSEPRYPGKEHPLVSVFQKTRRIFLEMGFSEIVSPCVESSFWDFDALFQPQDHPARDMQDTFYTSRPLRCRLPDHALVDRVGQTHENGGESGSLGWRYAWDRELAARPVLRTHTTAATIRALARDPNPPRKVFLVGPVFRRETVDYKHLPVFHQVDGVIIDAHASLATLLGTLKAFYTKMGFSRFQFRPGFFPYTEPSVEVFVWSEKKQDWVEMGGAGVFRPEVTRALGCTVPVLAWGLGLERLALFQYELESIGELYRSHLSWLKETSLCR